MWWVNSVLTALPIQLLSYIFLTILSPSIFQVGCFGLQKIIVKTPKKIPPNSKFSHPSRIYPGLALK